MNDKLIQISERSFLLTDILSLIVVLIFFGYNEWRQYQKGYVSMAESANNVASMFIALIAFVVLQYLILFVY